MKLDNVRRLAAFTADPAGGNPAGVWLGERLPDAREMQAIAADVGYSETAFAARTEGERWLVRYFSPLAEVPFCGHATIALGVVLGEEVGEGVYRLDTRAGAVPVSVRTIDGVTVASLTSVEPSHRPAPQGLIDEVLEILDWRAADLDPEIPAAVAYAGAHHLVLAAARRETLRRLAYDFDRLQRLMLDHDLTTLQLVWRQEASVFQARNPFPVGGVIEDPATGAAAAAFGGYLRALGLVDPPASIVIHQGVDLGRPSRLDVTIPPRGGILVEGRAVPIS